MTEWKQERPMWCHHSDCIFKRRCQDAFCCGELPKPDPHHDDFNYYRICVSGFEDGIGQDYLVNNTDLEYMRWIFDALDGKTTSWISRIGTEAYAKEGANP